MNNFSFDEVKNLVLKFEKTNNYEIDYEIDAFLIEAGFVKKSEDDTVITYVYTKEEPVIKIKTINWTVTKFTNVFGQDDALHLDEKIQNVLVNFQNKNEAFEKARQDSIDRFQNGDTKLMIAGLRTGNLGINLTRAKYVIFAELDWSPAYHYQAEDRLHRIGQKNTVFAYYLIGSGTLDDHVADILVDKSYEIDAIMDQKQESFENKEKAKLILAQIHDKISST